MRRPLLAALTLIPLITALPAAAQQFAANAKQDYRVCPVAQTERGRAAVAAQCGDIVAPDFAGARFSSSADLEAARLKREAFASQVSTYGRCVTAFINSYRRPGAPADSTAPDEAACAHAWAEDQATQTVRTFGRACVDYSNRSMTDRKLTPWSGACFPSITGTPG